VSRYERSGSIPRFGADLNSFDIADQPWSELDPVDAADYGDDYDPQVTNYLLSLGLLRFHQIVNADSYEVRHRLICSPRWGDRSENLYEALKNANVNRSDDDLFRSEYTREDDENLARYHPPFVQVSAGPAEAWRWAHQDEPGANFVHSD
jgi:hypothetical protein